MKLLVSGARSILEIPQLDRAGSDLHIEFAPGPAELAQHLPGTDILLGWDFRGCPLADHWQAAGSLKWIHWCGAGVDGVLFAELIHSDVVLTNARGIFDRAIAEYVLTLILAQAKQLPSTVELQQRRCWKHRLTGQIKGTKAIVFGVGSIGQEIAALLQAVGVEVTGVARTARETPTVFGRVSSADDALRLIRDADWVVGCMPHTAATANLFNEPFFSAMKPSAFFINVGRGSAVDEAALLAALETQEIAGAALDVFQSEPLDKQHPLWGAPNLIVSPHMSGDYLGHEADLANQFLTNLQRFRAGLPLKNVVNKALGYVQAD